MAKIDTRKANFDLKKDWDDMTDIEKLSWTVICNEDKEAEQRAYCKKSGIPFESKSIQDAMNLVNPMQRWYEYRSKEARRLKRDAKKAMTA